MNAAENTLNKEYIITELKKLSIIHYKIINFQDFLPYKL